MPAGLDGNPDPIVSPARDLVLEAAARLVLDAASESERVLVAIDGRSGAGKSTWTVEGPTALIFDGLFLQRPEFQSFWDQIVLLVADARIDQRWLEFLLSDLPVDQTNRAAALDERLHRARWPRYRDGWARYVESVRPAERASLVIDSNDFAEPLIVRAPGSG